jgi:simple sugar transport system substrate-binding protein
MKANITAGSFTIFEGPLKDNKGNIAIAAGSNLKETPEGNVKLESMSFLVDGVIGSTS